MAEQEKFFKRLTRLFRSGPVVKRKVKNTGEKTTSSVFSLFEKSRSNVYSNVIYSYGMYDRMSRYADFTEMEYTPEIAAALDIYADESCSPDDVGRSLHIHSENHKIKTILEDLFYDTLNVEFVLRMWLRNLCKYGDFFLFNDVDPSMGVINAFPIPVNEIEREEGYDPDDPMAVRFRWITQGNQVLENWQITHFRLLGNDAFLPYGSSILEPARRIWRQLILIEDAMLVYRIVRSPERRVFYIDVGAVPPEDIPTYVEQAKAALKTNQVIDKNTGRVDLRYNPMSVDEDYFVPVRGTESGTKIESLAGGTNVTAIEDVEYIQKKLFAALKVPRAYLGYDELLSSKATLAQEDIRFSRTIAYIQKVAISELNKLAIIHLFSHGFEGEELLDFTLQLSNPSTIAQQQKLELHRTKFEIAGAAPEGMLSKEYILKHVLGMTSKEIELIELQKVKDKIYDLKLESLTLPSEEAGGADLATGEEGGLGGEPAPEPTEEPGGDEGGEEGVPTGIFTGKDHKGELLTNKKRKTKHSDDELDPEISVTFANNRKSPIKPNNQIKTTQYNRSRRRTHGASKTHMPKFNDMLKHDNESFTDPFGISATKNPFKESYDADEFYDKKIAETTRLTGDIRVTLNKLKELQTQNLNDNNDIVEISDSLLTENINNEDQKK